MRSIDLLIATLAAAFHAHACADVPRQSARDLSGGVFVGLHSTGRSIAARPQPRINQAQDHASTPPSRAHAAHPVAKVSSIKGFQLHDERWTYHDGDFEMSGILLKPNGKGPIPAILISHGLGGAAESFGMQKAREMVQWGAVCIAPNYTHTTGGRPGGGQHPGNYGASAENLRRAKTCLDIAAAMPEVDPACLAAYGHSMGGFVTIGLAAAEPALLKAAAVTGSGVAPQSGFPAPAEAEAAKIKTPFLMLHGAEDPVVRPQQSEALRRILERNQVPNDRLVADGQGHPIDQTMREEVFRLIRDWFARHGVLKP